MRKILIALTMFAFVAVASVASSDAFAANKCDAVTNAAACKSTVHKETPKKAERAFNAEPSIGEDDEDMAYFAKLAEED